MRWASPHGAIRQLTRATWPRPRLTQSITSFGLTSKTQRSFENLQLGRDEEPFTTRLEPNQSAKDVAVIGGGITGLATAFELSRTMPNAKITLIERSKKVGGWMDSEIVPVDGGEAVFEWGPRSLRYTTDGSGAATIHLMANLNMASDIVATSQNSPAARNRYVYYPDHLVRMPGPLPGASLLMNVTRNLMSVFSESVFKGLLTGMLAEPTVALRPADLRDESVGSFITRRFGRSIAENLVSAFLHGIYAGDIDSLSARTLLPQLWHLETMDPSGGGIMGSLTELFFKGRRLVLYANLEFLNQLSKLTPSPPSQLEPVLGALSGSSVYTFKRGLAQLVTRLESALRAAPNVTIKTDTEVTFTLPKLNPRPPDSKAINLSLSQVVPGAPSGPSAPDYPLEVHTYDYVISTIPLLNFAETLDTDNHPRFEDTRVALTAAAPESARVMVINLFYANPNLIRHQGFGYLLPRSIPLEQNPERALGVIFSSATSFGQDVHGATGAPLPGTKLTVMLGGHYWSTWSAAHDIPSPDESIRMARTLLARHLSVPLAEEPLVAKAKLADAAIPQYGVGYHQRMATAHAALLAAFKGRLKVAGWHVQGAVGVNDCVRSAWSVARSVREGWDATTGLDGFVAREGKEWVLVERDGTVVNE